MSAVISRMEQKCFVHQLAQPVGGSGVAAVGVVVVELFDDDGSSGLGFSYVLGGGREVEIVAKAVEVQLHEFVLQQRIPHPTALWRRINSSFSRVGTGPNLLALAAVDLAAWDLHSRRAGLPLFAAMGGVQRAIPVYGSAGFNTQQSASETAEIAQLHVRRGFRGVKPRVSGVPEDAGSISAVRAAVPDSVQVMIDANEKPDLTAAIRLMEVARAHDVLFVEEPLPSDAWFGYRALSRISRTPIAWGEHAQSLSQFSAYASEGFVACWQPDFAMIGGLTPVLDLCRLAEGANVTVSPHFLPGLFVHVGAASPALRWLEDFPLLEPLFDGWAECGPDGLLRPTLAPGHGLRMTA